MAGDSRTRARQRNGNARIFKISFLLVFCPKTLSGKIKILKIKTSNLQFNAERYGDYDRIDKEFCN